MVFVCHTGISATHTLIASLTSLGLSGYLVRYICEMKEFNVGFLNFSKYNNTWFQTIFDAESDLYESARIK